MKRIKNKKIKKSDFFSLLLLPVRDMVIETVSAERIIRDRMLKLSC